MLQKTRHCDESRFHILLFGDERSDEYRIAASHAERCQRCQNRLTNLAADAETWGEVGELLSGYSKWADSDSSPSSHKIPQPAWPRSAGPAEPTVDFLLPPSHPEMLGRLGRYEIERTIGVGGMGIVLKGFDTELNRPVAIKVLARHLAHSGPARQRFAREARAAAAVVHEHVVAIHNVESEGEVPFLVMQYVAGESLQARVDREGPLSAKEVLRIGIQAASGLAAAHEQGVVHRDVKPANILLENGVERVLVTDFGLARTVDDASLTHTGIVAGTPHYMSPEQASGETTDHRTDLFSLGAALYFAATGRPPYRAERAMGVLHRICHDRHRPAWEVNPEIPDPLSDTIDRLLAKKPDRRFTDAGQLKQTLSRTLARLQQRGLSRRHSPGRFVRRHAKAVFLTSAAGLAAAALAGLVAVAISNSWWSSRASTSHSERPATSVANAAWNDTAEYPAALGDINDRIDRLEEAVGQSVYVHTSDPSWTSQVQSMHRQLDRLQNDPVMPSSDSATKRR